MYRLSLVVLLGVAATGSAAPPPVTALAYRPDGQLLAVGTRDAVLLVDPAKGDVTGDLPGQTGRVTGLAFSKGGLLAVASGEPGKSGVVRLYPAGATEPVAEFTAHKDAVYAIAFGPDGKTLATAGYDRLVKLWDVPPKGTPAAPRATLADHSDSVYAVAFSPDGKLLASAAADRAVKVWDTATGKRLYTLGDATDWLYAVAWSPTGTRLAAGGVDKSVRVWEATAEGGRLVGSAFAHDKAVSRLLFSSDGKTLYSVGEDRVVKAWEPGRLTETKVFSAQPDSVLSAALRPDGKQLAVGRFDGVVQLLDPATGTVTATPVPAKPKPPAVAKLTPDAVTRGGTVRVAVEGTGLDTVAGAKASAAGVAAKVVSKDRTRAELEVTTTDATMIGPANVTLVGPGGESAPARVWVDRFPLAAERDTTDAARTGMTVAPPVTVAGQLDRAGDADFYRFPAKAGQEVGVQLTTPADAKTFDPVLTLSDETGQVVAEGRGGRLGFVCPAAGVYSVGVRDREFRGGAGITYRLHLGPVPVVTGVVPLAVQRGVETKVRVSGVNLGRSGGLTMPVTPPVDAMLGSKLPVPLPLGDVVGSATVIVGEFPATAVGSDGTATLPAVPGSADGVLGRSGEAHTIRFAAKKGQRLIVETEADRLGSPVDSFLEILDASGKPVPRAVLRCLAKTSMNLRDRSSSDPGLRLEAWNELAMKDFLYADGELMQIDELPRGPDDDCKFIAVDGRRVGFLGTTPKYHAYGATLYKVAVHPPGTSFPPNGMPVFPLFDRNDDGGPGYSKDSRVTFDPPADGEYLARVTDATGAGSQGHAYRLTVRPPRPDFTVRLAPAAPTVPRGGAASVTITATRTDGFDGPIEVRFDGLAPPFRAPATTIEPGRMSAVVPLSTGPEPLPAKPSAFRLVARAVIDGKEVIREAAGGTPKLADKPGDLVTKPAVSELTIRPGEEARLVVKIERHGFNGRVPLDVRGLPYGVRVMNVGLSGILVLPNQTEREVVIFAEPWVEPTDRPFAVVATREGAGEFAAPAVTLKVRK